jgi:hypothetical protein
MQNDVKVFEVVNSSSEKYHLIKAKGKKNKAYNQYGRQCTIVPGCKVEVKWLIK